MRRGQLRHVEAVRYAFLVNVITDRRIEDRLIVLAGNNAPRGEGAAITNGVDFELDGFVRVTCAQKISVQAMGLQRRWNRLVGWRRPRRPWFIDIAYFTRDGIR